MRVLLTGGAGFIGFATARYFTSALRSELTVLDKLTYAANPTAVQLIPKLPRTQLLEGDIANRQLLAELFAQVRPEVVVHMAAESHVDRSIEEPGAFIQTNIVGTANLLDAALAYWSGLPAGPRADFRFLQVSTDEVYGSIEKGAANEASPFRPNSPYAASKAGADHLARAWGRTYGLPVMITHATNNYGPWQMPEKLIPHTIVKALAGEPLPIYGDGKQVRDWIHVEDHVAALAAVLAQGRPGESYNIGARNELENRTLVRLICSHLDRLKPRDDGKSYAEQMQHVTDRPGHDRRYAVEDHRLGKEIQLRPMTDFAKGLADTVGWYLQHEDWWRSLLAAGTGDRRIGLARQAAT